MKKILEVALLASFVILPTTMVDAYKTPNTIKK